MRRILTAVAEGVRRGNAEADMLRDGWKVARRPAAGEELGFMGGTWYWREETRSSKRVTGQLHAQVTTGRRAA